MCTTGVCQGPQKNQALKRCQCLWQAKARLPETSVPVVEGCRRRSAQKAQGLIWQGHLRPSTSRCSWEGIWRFVAPREAPALCCFATPSRPGRRHGSWGCSQSYHCPSPGAAAPRRRCRAWGLPLCSAAPARLLRLLAVAAGV